MPDSDFDFITLHFANLLFYLLKSLQIFNKHFWWYIKTNASTTKTCGQEQSFTADRVKKAKAYLRLFLYINRLCWSIFNYNFKLVMLFLLINVTNDHHHLFCETIYLQWFIKKQESIQSIKDRRNTLTLGYTYIQTNIVTELWGLRS